MKEALQNNQMSSYYQINYGAELIIVLSANDIGWKELGLHQNIFQTALETMSLKT